jgi:hypothetical protein
MSSLYGQLVKQEADYTKLCDEKIPEFEKLSQVNIFSKLNECKSSFKHLKNLVYFFRPTFKKLSRVFIKSKKWPEQ